MLERYTDTLPRHSGHLFCVCVLIDEQAVDKTLFVYVSVPESTVKRHFGGSVVICHRSFWSLATQFTTFQWAAWLSACVYPLLQSE